MRQSFAHGAPTDFILPPTTSPEGPQPNFYLDTSLYCQHGSDFVNIVSRTVFTAWRWTWMELPAGDLFVSSASLVLNKCVLWD